MNNKKIFVAVLVVVLLILGLGLVAMRYANAPTTKDTDVLPVSSVTSEMTIQNFTYTASTTRGSNEVVVEYPQFKNQTALNLSIEQSAKKEFEDNKASLISDRNEMLANEDYSESNLDYVNTKTVNKDLVYINPVTGIASIGFDGYGDTGGAHGSFWYDATTYDLRTGKELALGNLLHGYDSILRQYVLSAVKNTTSPNPSCENCENLKDEDISDGVMKYDLPPFFVNEKGLTLLYGAYGLGSYAATAGGQKVLVPMSGLSAVISRPW